MLHIEIYKDGCWQLAARFEVKFPERGHRGASTLNYDVTYAGDNLYKTAAVVSCRYTVNFTEYAHSHWPAFMLDLLPSGAGRRHWLEGLSLQDGLSAEYELLKHAASNPPGNLRIRESFEYRNKERLMNNGGILTAKAKHEGFRKSDILERHENFIEYAYQMGAHVAGASDVQGEAPKFLLVQDHHGRWHAEGGIDDSEVAKHWIVKFPRGRTERDRMILANEAPYLEVARACGLQVGEALVFEEDALFIPRFDREISHAGVERFAMESLCSLAGVAEYGQAVNHEILLEQLLKFVAINKQSAVLLEYMKRDALNVALGNKDNHSRNTAILRDAEGVVRLSPLFDFAPMYLDPEGIARVCRWQIQRERGGSPNWANIAAYYGNISNSENNFAPFLQNELSAFAGVIEKLPDIMQQCGVVESIIEMRMQSIASVAQSLQEC